MRLLADSGLTNRQRLLVLLLVMATVGLTAAGLSLWSLYRTAFAEERARLIEIVQSHARLIEAVARFDATHSKDADPLGAAAATLSQVIDAHARYQGFGETGEFTLARREVDEVVFLLSFRHENSRVQQRLPFRGDLAEPMRRALEGKSGSMVGLDYRGVKVLAAHEPVAVLDAGIIAKIDLAEIRAPFTKAGALSLGGAMVIIGLGMVLFHHFGSPLVEHLESMVTILRNAQRIAHIGNWEWDIKRNSLWWSAEVYRIFGLDPVRFAPSYESYLAALHPEDRGRAQATVNASMDDKAPFIIEHRIVLPDGRERFVQEQGETFFDKAGNPLRMTGTLQDISERKTAEAALRDSERLVREQLESRVQDRTRELTSLNEDLHREVEKRNQAQEALSRSFIDQEIIASILTLSLQPLPLVEILRQALVLVLQRHGLGLSIQGCVFLLDEDTGELVMKVRHGLPESIVESCSRLPLGRCLCGLAAQSGKVIHADRIDERHELTYAGIKPHGHCCVPIQDEGELFGVLNLYVPQGHQHTLHEEQFVLAIADTLAGVIRRRRTEDALRASEANLAEAQRIAHLGSWNWDIVHDKLTWSAEIFRIFGIPQKQFGVTYEAFLERVHPVDRDRLKQAVDAALYQHQSYDIEHRILLPDSTERTVHEKAKVDFDADGHPVRMFGTIQDVTEQKRIKETLRRIKEELEKKERNRLAALLHDGVGQNLQAVNLGLKMVAEKADPDVAKILMGLDGEVRNAIEQVRNLSSELSPANLEQMDLAEAMRSHVSKLAVRVKADLRLVTDRKNYACLDERVKEHCFLVFQEALTNAIKHSDASVIEIRVSVVGEVWLLIEISDNGSGFSPRKTSERDGGLGISIIQDRAQRLGGKVAIQSTPGKRYEHYRQDSLAMIRLLLADDHAIFRQGLAQLLAAWPEAEVVAEAADGQEAWALIRKHKPDVAVVDIKMPHMSGIEIAEHVRAQGLSTRVVLLTMHDEPALALEAEHAGVHGYVLKDNTFEELSQAIEQVTSGRRYMSPSVAEKFQAFRLNSGGVTLSPREREVLKLIASGLSSKSIARELDISPKTVETHRGRLMTKLNLHSIADLVRYAVQTGFLSK